MRKGKIVIGLFALLLISMLAFSFNIQPVKASGTIHIRDDGSVEGTDKIRRDGDVYTFIDNVKDSIVVERDNIVVDGAGYTLQGTGDGTGIDGIDLYVSSNNSVSGNDITNNDEDGIRLGYSSIYNSISGNNITDNKGYGDYESPPPYVSASFYEER